VVASPEGETLVRRIMNHAAGFAFPRSKATF
jgi:hypothetical protein